MYESSTNISFEDGDACDDSQCSCSTPSHTRRSRIMEHSTHLTEASVSLFASCLLQDDLSQLNRNVSKIFFERGK